MNDKNSLPVKKVCAIHDLSGFGRCALTVISPVLSCMKLQMCPIPTAVLSTHTGGFCGYEFLDLTDIMQNYYMHWKELDIKFDAIYSGFLGNEAQIEHVCEIIKLFGKGTAVLVDPVMGDDGVLYSTYNENLRCGMKELIKHADIITPNITEAEFLLDRTPKSEYHDTEIKEILLSLLKKGPKNVVITGIHEKGKIVTVWQNERGEYGKVALEHIPKNYPGTGDIFSSVLLGKILQGCSLSDSARFASEFVYETIKYSSKFDYNLREGVLIEACLDKLL